MRLGYLERKAISRVSKMSDEAKAAIVSGFLVFALCLCLVLFISVPIIGR